jgi:hypothetical protein
MELATPVALRTKSAEMVPVGRLNGGSLSRNVSTLKRATYTRPGSYGSTLPRIPSGVARPRDSRSRRDP